MSTPKSMFTEANMNNQQLLLSNTHWSQTLSVDVWVSWNLLNESKISMGVVGAAGILDFERSYSGWVKDERRPSNPRKSIYQPDMLEQTYH